MSRRPKTRRARGRNLLLYAASETDADLLYIVESSMETPAAV